MTEITVVETQTLPAERKFFEANPAELVKQAAAMARPLCDVIEKQKLYTLIQGKKHVRVEGWQTLGNMLGILPRDTKVIEHEDGTFEAYVDLISYKTGMVVGGGSAICATDEKRWKGADRYARRSMAVTRATGKAYRLCFGWIMTMSGYESTPAEEMPPEVYEGTLQQKAELSKVFNKLEISEPAVMKEISQAVMGMPMARLSDAVAEYIANPM